MWGKNLKRGWIYVYVNKHITKYFFHTVHAIRGVLKARILKWFAIPFSSGPHFVRTLYHDPSVLGGPTQHGLVSLS